MKVKVKIMSYSVLHGALSIKLLCEDPGGLVNEAKDEKRRVGLDDLSFEAKVRSISIKRGMTNVLLRAKRNRYIVLRLFELMEKEAVELSIFEILDEKISYLLSKASQKLAEPEKELLLRLTTFRDREKNEIPGKKSIQDISEGQKEVVLRKLNAILREEDASCSVS
ncbi:MAG: hypothetical protein FJ106_01640 [Deltaproteobacteria bacterium]|nr:hypothetical protein [Deltaproteobacteria bacterium]